MLWKPQEPTWESLRAKRMTEPGAAEEYKATRLAYEQGLAVHQYREAASVEATAGPDSQGSQSPIGLSI